MPAVLITGASRGIGRATALRLAAAGWDVYAGVRAAKDATGFAGTGSITPVTLDVTNADHLAALDAALPARLDAVVNNAGIVVGGPVEGVSLDELRQQLDVNVVGQAAVTQAVLPRLRQSRGRVVFVSSISGRVSTPMTGAYSASKFALEGLADALRMELAPWGVRVSIIEPAQTDTDLWQLADAEVEATRARLSGANRELYARHIEGYRKSIPRSQRQAAPAEGVAAVIERALTAGRPRARYVVGGPAKALALITGVMPTVVLDRVLSLSTGVPRKL